MTRSTRKAEANEGLVKAELTLPMADSDLLLSRLAMVLSIMKKASSSRNSPRNIKVPESRWSAA